MIEKTDAQVKTQDGGNWNFTLILPETLAEAEEIYGSDGTLSVFNAGLTVKQQNLARDMFKNGKSREEVDAAVRDYRPGVGGRSSAKADALRLIMEKADILRENGDLLTQVQEAFVGGKFKDVVEALR